MFVRDLLPGFSTDLDQIAHRQAVGARKRRREYIPKIRSIGLLAAAGEVVTHERTESQTIIMDMSHGSVKVRDNWLRSPLGVNTQSGNWPFHPPVVALKKFKDPIRMYGNGYSMAIVLDHRSTALTETKIGEC